MINEILICSEDGSFIEEVKKRLDEFGFSYHHVFSPEECKDVLLEEDFSGLILNRKLLGENGEIYSEVDRFKFFSSNNIDIIVVDPDRHSPDPGVSFIKGIYDYFRKEDLSGSGLYFSLLHIKDRRNLISEINILRDVNKEKVNIMEELNLKNAVLDRERNFSSNIINSITAGLVIIDLDSHIIAANEEGRRIFSITDKDFLGKDLMQTFKKQDSEVFMSHVEKASITGVPQKEEKYWLNGILVGFTVYPVYSEKKENIGSIFLASDITETEAAKDQLNQAERLATIGTMLSGIAHEMRNPLTIINARAQRLLSKNKNADEKSRRSLDSIYEQSRRCGEIVNNLLNFSRRKAMGVAYNDIHEVLEEVLSFVSMEGRTKGVKIKKQCSVDLPLKVKCDRTQIQQVFLNLLTNSIDAMEGDGEIIIHTEKVPDAVLVSVKDNGPGIPEDNLKKIFNPFFTTKETGKGTGLGLSLVQKIVSAHNGDVGLSTSSEGTEFRVLLSENGKDPVKLKKF
ncbi:MAG: two-component system sensor histidine kinase NtrB [Fibrobacterota bacterium]